MMIEKNDDMSVLMKLMSAGFNKRFFKALLSECLILETHYFGDIMVSGVVLRTNDSGFKPSSSQIKD